MQSVLEQKGFGTPCIFCGFCNFSEPLIIYIMKKENSAVEDKEGDNCERRFV